MPMNRILEFTPSPEEAVVSRILVLVHQAVDESFPATAQTSRQFTKTVFSGEGERTAASGVPGDTTAFSGEEDTASDNRASPDHHPEAHAGGASQLPLPPPPRPSLVPPPPRGAQPGTPRNAEAAAGSQSSQPLEGGRSQHGTRPGTRLDESMAGLEGESPDWWTRILIGLLIAGAIVFVYAAFF